MPEGPNAAQITVRETLDLLDGPFESFVAGIAEDRYAFWLGSGISLNRVDGLGKVVPRVIEFLRVQIDPESEACPFRVALGQALALATLSDAERDSVDYTRPFDQWPIARDVTKRLINNYSRLLNINVGELPNDYLLWNGIDIAGTFANPAIEPDVEHLGIAILALEGCASDIATANWDGLVEKAVGQLAQHEILNVCVRSEDIRDAGLQSKLYKFHGCAVRAVENEDVYRPYLVGRSSQITGWLHEGKNQALVLKLKALLVTKPTLMLGLSVQDENIRILYDAAGTAMPWPWPSSSPSYVFSENSIGADQQALLQNVYREQYDGQRRAEIETASLLRAYAKPLLVALVLDVLSRKLAKLCKLALPDFPAVELAKLVGGQKAVRDHVATIAAKRGDEFLLELVHLQGQLLSLFRLGTNAENIDKYSALTNLPVQRIVLDQNMKASGLPELAVVTGILGLGVADHTWVVDSKVAEATGSALLTIKSDLAESKLFIVADSRAVAHLRQSDHIQDDDDAIILTSDLIAEEQVRSPRGAFGRTGKPGIREISLRTLASGLASSDQLVQEFRKAAGI